MMTPRDHLIARHEEHVGALVLGFAANGKRYQYIGPLPPYPSDAEIARHERRARELRIAARAAMFDGMIAAWGEPRPEPARFASLMLGPGLAPRDAAELAARLGLELK